MGRYHPANSRLTRKTSQINLRFQARLWYCLGVPWLDLQRSSAHSQQDNTRHCPIQAIVWQRWRVLFWSSSPCKKSFKALAEVGRQNDINNNHISHHRAKDVSWRPETLVTSFGKYKEWSHTRTVDIMDDKLNVSHRPTKKWLVGVVDLDHRHLVFVIIRAIIGKQPCKFEQTNCVTRIGAFTELWTKLYFHQKLNWPGERYTTVV